MPAAGPGRLPAVSAWTPVLLAVVALPLLLDALVPGRPAVAVLDVAHVAICLVGLALTRSAARRESSYARRGPWGWMTLAFACRLWGEAVSAWLEAGQGAQPFPPVADIGFVAFYPAVAVALLRFPTPGRSPAHRGVLLLDVVTVAAGAFVVLWHVLVSDLLVAGVSTLSGALTLAYTVGDALLLLVAARFAVLGTARTHRVAGAVVVAALISLVVADVLFGRQGLDLAPDGLHPLVDLGWTAGLVLLAVAADIARSTREHVAAEQPAAPAGTSSELPPAPSPLLYAAALLTLALVGSVAAQLPLHPVGGLLYAAIAVVLAVILRQVVVGREQARLVRLYESAAIEDTLTGALTRRRLLELGGRLVARGRAAIFVIDVDHFKAVNDTHGHSAGDAVLTEVTRRAQAALRPGDLLGRYGGDEFVAVLPGADPVTALRVAQRLHTAATGETVTAGEVQIPVSLSVGVATSAAGGSLVALVDLADEALYAAKATGRGRVISADEHARARAAEPTPPTSDAPTPAPLTADDLQRAVTEHHLAVHYQPRLDLRTGTLTCAEAFVRWQHPERGLLDAGTFLPALQDRASLVLLTEHVLALALADCAAWRAVDPALRVAVNLPRDLLQDPWLPARLLEALTTAGLPADALELEITEDALGGDPVAARVVAELRAVGLRVAVDDFGTGATSLTTLRCHTLDVLKIDPSLLASRLADPRDLAVIRAVAGLGHELGLTVVAEGVEDEASRTLLASLGVDEVQGHLVSRPVPAGVLLPFLATRAGDRAQPAPPARLPQPFAPSPDADLVALLAPVSIPD